jgi:hypothetical protein
MLSAREIADYVYGPTRAPEYQQFTFSEEKRIGDVLSMSWHPGPEANEDKPGPIRKIALVAKVNKATAEISMLRARGFGESPAARRNILLILLFIVIFAAMFVLESRHAPANPMGAFSPSNSTVIYDVSAGL